MILCVIAYVLHPLRIVAVVVFPRSPLDVAEDADLYLGIKPLCASAVTGTQVHMGPKIQSDSSAAFIIFNHTHRDVAVIIRHVHRIS